MFNRKKNPDISPNEAHWFWPVPLLLSVMQEFAVRNASQMNSLSCFQPRTPSIISAAQTEKANRRPQATAATPNVHLINRVLRGPSSGIRVPNRRNRYLDSAAQRTELSLLLFASYPWLIASINQIPEFTNLVAAALKCHWKRADLCNDSIVFGFYLSYRLSVKFSFDCDSLSRRFSWFALEGKRFKGIHYGLLQLKPPRNPRLLRTPLDE